jgi:23S rRNA pseudouridine1911/1915/1917 synthase
VFTNKISISLKHGVYEFVMQENYPQYIEHILEFKVAPGQTPERLDLYISRNTQNATRNKVQRAISEGNVTVNGKKAKQSRKVQPNDHIICKILKPPPIELVPENIPLDIVFEDECLMVINKQAGMCVHPGFGNRYGTLVNALLYHFGEREIKKVEYDDEEDDEGEIFAGDSIRPGIVHRLDKDTSGLLVVAKNPIAHAKLADQFANKTTTRKYNALVWGVLPDEEGVITGNIGRSSRDRKLFEVQKRGGKYAETEYKVIERFHYLTLVELKLLTGRTHQIRVHMKSINHSVFGDQSYGGDTVLFGGQDRSFRIKAEKALVIAKRQMLHAKTLGFKHPETNELLEFDSELPIDFQQVLNIFH